MYDEKKLQEVCVDEMKLSDEGQKDKRESFELADLHSNSSKDGSEKSHVSVSLQK